MDKKRLAKIPSSYRKSVERSLNAISQVIQTRREELGLTQEEFAEDLGISPMTLQFIEQKRRYPSLPMLFYILERLKFDVKVTKR